MNTKSTKIKRCVNCGRFLSENAFSYRDKQHKFRASYCKKCIATKTYIWKKMNKDKYKKGYKVYYQNNKNKHNEFGKKWRKNNLEKCAEYTSKRRALERNQIPLLIENNKNKMDLYYKISNYLGSDWSVDHIIPISKQGAHHPDNFQIMTKKENQKKSSKIKYKPKYSFRI